jgi:hypothetical protein
MFVPMNVTFVSLRLAKPTFQVKVVARQIGVIAAHEQTYLKTGHDRAHLPLNQIVAGPQLVAQDWPIQQNKSQPMIERGHAIAASASGLTVR